MVTAVPTTPADKAANDALSTSSPATGPSAVKVAEAAKGAEAAVAAGHQTGSLLERFVSDEMWEQNPVLRRFAPYLHQVERAMMVFGSSALAWAVGRSGWSFAWVLLVCLSMVPAWDRSLKVGFQRMKALARYEVLHSRVSDWLEWRTARMADIRE